ncbi:MAG: hypothetical protein QG656_123 [Candidatus Hydrogenedentes bacterium]|nr:hypothetical protein [Candidatus Hydrogenedentota bacterium]
MVRHDDVIATVDIAFVVVFESAGDEPGRIGIAKQACAMALVEFQEKTPGLFAFENVAEFFRNGLIPFVALGRGQKVIYSVSAEPGFSFVNPPFEDVTGDGIGQTEGDKIESTATTPMRQMTAVSARAGHSISIECVHWARCLF